MGQTDTDERLKAGTVIDGRYKVKSLLGTGGFANVYLAEHKMLGTDVAVKVLHAPLATASDSQFAARFEREARVAAQMRHPNVVNVTDFGFLEEGDPYIVMEYLQGRDLDQELKHFGPVAPDRLLRLMIPAIQACGEAHKMGVVHKDLKPSNLFLVDAGTPTERLIVLDYGVARVFDDADENITQTGAFTGTPAYLPPEYIREQRVTAAFDVYQMGLILIECMTGKQAIQADGPMGFLLAHCMGRLTVAPEFFENDLGRVIQRAIAIEDDQRYPDCAEMASALLQVQPPDPINFTGEHFVRDPGPMSSQDVAAFADTVSSGQIVGDAFVTGTGQIETGPRRPPASQEPTTQQPVVEEQDRGIGLYVIAAVLLLGIVAAGIGVVALISDSNTAVATESDAGVVDPLAMPAEIEEEPAGLVEAENAAEELAGTVDMGAEEVADEVAEAAEDSEVDAKVAADLERQKTEAAKREEAAERAERERKARERALAERKRKEERERERKLAEEKKSEADDKPQERLLLVD